MAVPGIELGTLGGKAEILPTAPTTPAHQFIKLSLKYVSGGHFVCNSPKEFMESVTVIL